MRLIDITRPLDARIPVWPGDTPFGMRWTTLRSQGAPVNLSTLTLSPHTGTHADAPYHVLEEGSRLGEMDLEAFVGAAIVVDVRGAAAIDDAAVASALTGAGRPERVLFRTGAWEGRDGFPTDFPGFAPPAVDTLRRAGVRLLGTDAPSVDPFDSETLPAHHAILGAGIAILENLRLDGVEPGAYELIALPLALVEADGSPVRAVLRAS